MSCDLSSRSQRVMEFQLVSLRQIGESLLKLLDDDLKDDLETKRFGKRAKELHSPTNRYDSGSHKTIEAARGRVKQTRPRNDKASKTSL